MPVDKQGRQDKASICLKIVVIGGSMAGLATAYALKRAGHDVRVIEKSDGKSKSLGHLQSPPNMTKILYRWGLQPLLDRAAHKCLAMVFRKGKSPSMSTSVLIDPFLKAATEDQYLKDVFFELATDEGVDISPSTSVTSLVTDPDTASVTLDNGETLSADFVVVADGYDSAFRALVTGVDDEDNKIPERRHGAATFILPLSLVSQDEDLRRVMDPSNWLIWIGAGFVLHCSFTNEGKDLATTITYNHDGEVRPEDEIWTDHPIEYYALDRFKFEPRVQKLLSLTKRATGRLSSPENAQKN
ncbi:hypothetical protein CPB84DRAFT_1963979 [Gymnopilus junonius]|uniref:FAD-binding domain-containing protein n=1 Tax=Gymnopilus junonius TaxID=109634 RepID=A0A9P5NGH3_GYMJU|nr:hypothetical protein CPB84DRAFT_1963979 [Gymnopilus junonius]